MHTRYRLNCINISQYIYNYYEALKSSSKICSSILIKWVVILCSQGSKGVCNTLSVSSLRWQKNLQTTSWHSFPRNILEFLDFSPKVLRGLNRISITVASNEAHVGHDNVCWHILKTNHLDITVLYKSNHREALINVSVA